MAVLHENSLTIWQAAKATSRIEKKLKTSSVTTFRRDFEEDVSKPLLCDNFDIRVLVRYRLPRESELLQSVLFEGLCRRL